MKQNKNRVFGLAGTVCAVLAAIACLIVEYGYEKIILPRGYQWMYPWMQTAVLTGAVVFTVFAVLCQLPASGKKKITAIGCVIVAGIGVVVCSGLSEAGQLQVLRSPAGNYQVKDEETGQLMLNRPYKGLFRYQKELLPFTADSKVNSRWLQEDACALYGTDTDGNPAAYLATYGSRSMDDIAYVDPLSTMHGIWEGTDADGQTWTLSVGGQDAVKDAWVRLSGKTVTSWYGEPECERYGTIGMILKDGTQADYFVVLNKDCVWGDSELIGSGSMTICKADLEEEPIILSRQGDVDSDRDWSDVGGTEDLEQATWAENPDSSFDAAFGVDAEDTDAGTGSQSNDEESWDEGADAGWLHRCFRLRGGLLLHSMDSFCLLAFGAFLPFQRYKATHRQGTQTVLGAFMILFPEHRPHADGKLIDLNAAELCHSKMPELVDGDHRTEHKQRGKNGDNK